MPAKYKSWGEVSLFFEGTKYCRMKWLEVWQQGAGAQQGAPEIGQCAEWGEGAVCSNLTRRFLFTLRKVVVGSVTGTKEAEICSSQENIIIYSLLKVDNNSRVLFASHSFSFSILPTTFKEDTINITISWMRKLMLIEFYPRSHYR